jgi:hypothetical protein
MVTVGPPERVPAANNIYPEKTPYQIRMRMVREDTFSLEETIPPSKKIADLPKR